LRDVEELPEWAAAVPERVRRLAAAFWPGPLTLVLKRAAGVLDLVTGSQSTVAVRVPLHPVAQQLLAAFGGAIAAPSANRYGHVSPTRADHVRDEFGASLACVLDGGDCEVGLESTIVDCSGDDMRVLRPGSITLGALRAVVPEVAGPDASTAVPRVPGSTLSHYAPGTPLLLASAVALPGLVTQRLKGGERIAVLASGPAPLQHAQLLWLNAGSDAARFGHDLYANLRALDRAGCACILVAEVAGGEEWDAVRDRLMRAASGAYAAPESGAWSAGVLP
jgi:L-threonylcarbamoyladenylate synthase